MMRLTVAVAAIAAFTGFAGGMASSAKQEGAPAAGSKPWLIAHRGASAYAPENTVPAFRVAADQGAAFVEFDLRLTKDGQIVCLHDDSLERTTDVEDVFPERFRSVTGAGGQAAKRWLLADFTLAELKTLDAGSWFGASFRGTRIPTFAETIDSLRGRSGLFIELKAPEIYEGIERMVLDELTARGLDRPGADPRTPVLLQSFTASSLQILAGTGTKLPLHFLVSAKDAPQWLTPEGLKRVKAFASGLSPEKTIVMDHPDGIARARQLGLLITPYTFRASAVTGFPDVRAEMAHYLDTLGVDGVITDNPDQMPARPPTRR
jgi:glycerophosphoryl diester phosphodiesterase